MTRRQLRDYPVEIFDYDPDSAGVLTDEQYADAQANPVAVPDLPAARRESFLPALPRQLPVMPTISAEADDANFALASAQALAAGAGGVFEHTSASDRTRADLWRAGGYALFGTVALLGAALATWGREPIGWLPAGIGLFGLIAMCLVHVASLRHSQAGVARFKVSTIRGMQKDRLDSRERLAGKMTSAWVDLVREQNKHEERMEDRKHGRK